MSQMLYPKFIPNILFIKILLITSSKKKLKLNPNIYFEDSEKIQKTEERTTPYRKNTRCNVWAKQNNFRTNNPNVISQLWSAKYVNAIKHYDQSDSMFCVCLSCSSCKMISYWFFHLVISSYPYTCSIRIEYINNILIRLVET